MSDTVTRGIRILVRPEYMAAESNPDQGHYLFAYHITIRNEGGVTVQRRSRHWLITNGEGQVEEVRGPGVVGQQPRLEPGASFDYTSYCPLDTPVGTMQGSFQMFDENGEEFDAVIEPFGLSRPGSLN